MKAKIDIDQSESREKGKESQNVSSLILNELWEELLYKEGVRWGMVISNSMYPVIRRGNQVLVEKATAGDIRFGDIFVFKNNGSLVTHRMLGTRKVREQLYVVEKGDALLHADLVPVESIIGKVSTIRMRNGKIRKLTGANRLTSLILSAVSRISLSGWTVLEYCLSLGRGHFVHHRIRELYIKSFTFIRKLIITIF
jgi:signal peptidase I